MFNLNFFSKKPTSYEMAADIKLSKAPKLTSARKGMWVVCDNRIGILNDIKEDECEVHFVDAEDGTTTVIIKTALDSLRQARYSEIPLVRRGFSLVTAKGMGYGD